jgi:hypothetical protein
MRVDSVKNESAVATVDDPTIEIDSADARLDGTRRIEEEADHE